MWRFRFRRCLLLRFLRCRFGGWAVTHFLTKPVTVRPALTPLFLIEVLFGQLARQPLEINFTQTGLRRRVKLVKSIHLLLSRHLIPVIWFDLVPLLAFEAGLFLNRSHGATTLTFLASIDTHGADSGWSVVVITTRTHTCFFTSTGQECPASGRNLVYVATDITITGHGVRLVLAPREQIAHVSSCHARHGRTLASHADVFTNVRGFVGAVRIKRSKVDYVLCGDKRRVGLTF